LSSLCYLWPCRHAKQAGARFFRGYALAPSLPGFFGGAFSLSIRLIIAGDAIEDMDFRTIPGKPYNLPEFLFAQAKLLSLSLMMELEAFSFLVQGKQIMVAREDDS